MLGTAWGIMTFIKPLINTADQKFVQNLGNLAEIIGAATRKKILNGELISDLFLATGTTNNVEHLLGRAPDGWVIAGKDANADIWELSRDRNFLVLQVDNDVTVSLWVF